MGDATATPVVRRGVDRVDAEPHVGAVVPAVDLGIDLGRGQHRPGEAARITWQGVADAQPLAVAVAETLKEGYQISRLVPDRLGGLVTCGRRGTLPRGRAVRRLDHRTAPRSNRR